MIPAKFVPPAARFARWLSSGSLWALLRVGAGYVALALGLIGVLLPIIPGLPFLLVGCWLLGWKPKVLERFLPYLPASVRSLIQRMFELSPAKPAPGRVGQPEKSA
jgi:hypothetical protein